MAKARAQPDSPATGNARLRAPCATLAHLRVKLLQVDGLGAAWRFIRWFGGAVLRWGWRRFRIFPPPANYPLVVEIAALGARLQTVFAASRCVARTTAGKHLELVVARGGGSGGPDGHSRRFAAYAVDPRTNNPIGWRRDVGSEVVGALGPLELLPPGCGASRVVRRDDQAALRELHHLEDVAAFHADTPTRAGELVRLAATGVLVRLADKNLTDRDSGLAPYLGAELFGLMTHEVRGLDVDGREALCVRMWRAALREHSRASHARQAAERGLADPPRLPLVSILLATRRPQLLERALAAVRRQTYPRLELVLGLHGEGFGAVAPEDAGLSVPVTALRLDAALPLGSVLNAATEASCGTLLAKMDDDDLYGPDHIWDLVLAHEYSQAPLVGKAAGFVYLAASDRTVRFLKRTAECYESGKNISGGALMIERPMLDRVGGWRPLRGAVDQALCADVIRAGALIYRTHSYGFLLVRHGREHTWPADDAWFLERADVDNAGWRPEMAGIDGAPLPYSIAPEPAPGAQANACA